MSRRLTVTDGYAVINALSDEMFGANATITATDVSSFASVGESILASGLEEVTNTLSLPTAWTAFFECHDTQERYYDEPRLFFCHPWKC